jgi:D-hexose-6-phosphate mutarotase
MFFIQSDDFKFFCFCRRSPVRGGVPIYSTWFQQVEGISVVSTMLCAQFTMEDHGDASNQPDTGQTDAEKSRFLLAGKDNCI